MLQGMMGSLQAIGSSVLQLSHQINMLTSQHPAPPSATPCTARDPTAMNSARPHYPQRGNLLFHPPNIIPVT